MEMEKTVMTMMIALMGVALMSLVVRGLVPTRDYCCPLCPECFYTYDELYSHFTTAHPAVDIEIIWE